MPGYGILGPDEGSGLLPWPWARQLLAESRYYWVCTVRPDGRPHVMPVWGVWDADELWFSSALRSRKALNLAHDPRCTAATQDPENPVVVEGGVSVIHHTERLARFTEVSNAKYGTDYSVDFYDPAVNGVYVLRPGWAFALRHDDFAGSPTRWRFDG